MSDKANIDVTPLQTMYSLLLLMLAGSSPPLNKYTLESRILEENKVGFSLLFFFLNKFQSNEDIVCFKMAVQLAVRLVLTQGTSECLSLLVYVVRWD